VGRGAGLPWVGYGGFEPEILLVSGFYRSCSGNSGVRAVLTVEKRRMGAYPARIIVYRQGTPYR
jgi:hypothetical protein